MVPDNSDGIPRVPPYSGVCLYKVVACVRGLHPLRPAVPDGSTGLPSYLMTDPITPALASPQRRFGLFPVRSPLLGESFLLSSPAGTGMFRFPAFASRYLAMSGSLPTGCPIRISRGRRVFAPRPGFSQLVTSFFASESLGIPHAPFVCSVFSSFTPRFSHQALHGPTTFASCLRLHRLSPIAGRSGARLLYSLFLVSSLQTGTAPLLLPYRPFASITSVCSFLCGE